MPNDSIGVSKQPHFEPEKWDGIDLLGREVFAKNLAQRIQTWRGKESLVIGLFGEWGGGKTVMKEMILKSLRDDPDTCPLLLEFNSWEWSGRDKLTAAFFKQIRIVLGKDDAGEAANESALRFKYYEKYLKATSIGLEGLSAILEKSSAFIVLLPFAVSTYAGSAIAKGVSFVIGGIVVVLQFFGFLRRFLKSISKTFAADAERNQKDLEDIKRELSKSLLRLERPLLIVIDDVDRLSADEIKTLFRLVKSNVNFPNIIYLLLFQKDVIAHALAKTFKVESGEKYLKKIIQVGFDLPAIERRRLNAVLENKINQIVLEHKLLVDQTRLKAAFDEGFSQAFGNLRDVNRFLNSFDFHLGIFKRENALEVDCVDLAVVEALSLSEEAVFKNIPKFRKPLLRKSEAIYAKSDEKNKEYEKAIESLVELAADSNKQQVKSMITFLFPSSYHASGENLDRWFREFRICDSDAFDRYFLLSIPIGAMSKNEVQAMLDVTDNSDKLCSILKEHQKQGRLIDALRYLGASVVEIDINRATPFITALFNIGDYEETYDDYLGLHTVSTTDTAERAIYYFLNRIQEMSDRSAVLLQAVNATSGFYLPVWVVANVIRKERQKDYQFVPENDMQGLKDACLRCIRAWSQSTSATSHSRFGSLLYFWKEWGNSEPSLWIKNLVSTKEGLQSYMDTSFKNVDLDNHFGDEGLLNAMLAIERYVPLEHIENQIKTFSLNPDENRSVRVFKTGLEKLAAWKKHQQASQGQA